ncbi:hypothetical protein [Cellvibrio japonicus]|uniref:hypothetical protein n=1 Tax=Cellvibrio japonicus TaxID=155077 RepID=UPI0011D168A6|nr:hypothetical protein [Cellvibrio japonicus]QEI11246.1 hypothetical protein FY117_02685 [Cellvibrio japonicus]QEI14820.1 hypothetical protein FY116_02685 [Cellvibrio japonicus]QEI18400.1 hypothetical protein FY115_02685 [Cellvibrio japonicus]
MEIINWVLSSVSLSIFLWIFIINWLVVLKNTFRTVASSWIPLVGGCLGATGIFLLPLKGINKFWWIPFLAEWGCIPGFLYTAVHYLKRK